MVFESRPDALVQMAALAAKSGNAVILKGGREAARTNGALCDIIRAAGAAAGLPADWLSALETREDVAELLALDEYVDLIVPRGSKDFVAHIKAESRIPVLGHSDGVCHVYLHEDAEPAMAAALAVDSKAQYPAACNAAEVLLVHSAFAKASLAAVAAALEAAKVRLDLDARSAAALGRRATKTDEDWSVEYLDLRMAVKVVDSLGEAIAHINRYGSRHTDAIVTGSRAAAEEFMNRVDSSSVYWNASTRFADGYRYGLGAELGISTGKLHARGPVGLEGLCTYKWKLAGKGHMVADYASGARTFLHEELGNGE
jgi:glutamate-5-semialdehyde dehydrogenase